MTNIKISGDWRNQGASFVKIDNAWRPVSRTFVKIDGVWKNSTFGSPPPKPIINWHSTGQFIITNYSSVYNYQTRFANGSGNATLNTSTGIYTLSGANSGFFVSVAYAEGSIRSAEAYMERKAYRYSCRPTTTTCCGGCNCRLDAAGYCIAESGQCSPGHSQSWGQLGCPGFMCWIYYNGVVCDTCCSPCPGPDICDVLINEPGYINSGTEWYKVS